MPLLLAGPLTVHTARPVRTTTTTTIAYLQFTKLEPSGACSIWRRWAHAYAKGTVSDTRVVNRILIVKTGAGTCGVRPAAGSSTSGANKAPDELTSLAVLAKV